MKKIILILLFLLVFGCAKKAEPPDIPEYKPIARVTRQEIPKPEPIRVSFETVQFEFDCAYIRDTRAVEHNAKIIIEHDSRVIIEGHTCDMGTAQYNLSLGQARAEAVKQFYIDYGVSAFNIKTISYGLEKPISQDKILNRRAETRAN